MKEWKKLEQLKHIGRFWIVDSMLMMVGSLNIFNLTLKGKKRKNKTKTGELADEG